MGVLSCQAFSRPVMAFVPPQPVVTVADAKVLVVLGIRDSRHRRGLLMMRADGVQFRMAGKPIRKEHHAAPGHHEDFLDAKIPDIVREYSPQRASRLSSLLLAFTIVPANWSACSASESSIVCCRFSSAVARYAQARIAPASCRASAGSAERTGDLGANKVATCAAKSAKSRGPAPIPRCRAARRSPATGSSTARSPGRRRTDTTGRGEPSPLTLIGPPSGHRG